MNFTPRSPNASLKTSAFVLIISALLAGCVQISVIQAGPQERVLEVGLVTRTGEPTAAAATGPAPSLTPDAATSTPTRIPPSATATLPPTLASTSTPTATESVATAVVNVNANCRAGPGVVYRVVIYINPGEHVDLVGRAADSTWWLVRRQGATEPCWVSASVLTLSGETGDVAVVAAPPAPTATLRTASTQPPRDKPGSPPTAQPSPAPYP